ncbi:dual specificity protein phosphatase PHS1 isoform X2 [Tanacetum coccineum]
MTRFCSYAHGSPLLENSSAFKTQKAAEKTSAALGRILMLDLVIRNEDRLPRRYLQWRGNSTNLLLADKMSTANHALEDAFDSAIKRCRPRVIRALQKDRRSTSVNSKMSTDDSNLATKSSDLSNPIESPLSLEKTLKRQVTIDPIITNFDIVAIDSGVPRKPPAGKRAHDQESYPKLVELLINSPEYASNLLHKITTGKLGVPPETVETSSNLSFIKDMNLVGTLSRWLCEVRIVVADHYTQVIGTDISEHQLKLAKPHPRVRYLHTPLSLSGDDLIDLLIGGESSVDLVTVAQAVHWFETKWCVCHVGVQ